MYKISNKCRKLDVALEPAIRDPQKIIAILFYDVFCMLFFVFCFRPTCVKYWCRLFGRTRHNPNKIQTIIKLKNEQPHIRSQPTPGTILVSHIYIYSKRNFAPSNRQRIQKICGAWFIVPLRSLLPRLRNKKRWTSEATGIVSLTGPSTAGIDPCALH